MKRIALATLALILGSSAFSEPARVPLVQITARYEGFTGGRYVKTTADTTQFYENMRDEVATKISGTAPEQQPAKKASREALATPQVTTLAGERCGIDVRLQEIQVPKTPSGEKSVNTGISLDVLPIVKDGKN